METIATVQSYKHSSATCQRK